LGAVEIDTGHERATAEAVKAKPGDWLQIQPGRDRLHDNAAFVQLRDLVRFSLDYYANRYRAREARSAELLESSEPATIKQERALETLDRHQEQMPATVFREVRREVTEALKASKSEELALDRRAALLAPLASAGMAALALNHELSREARFLEKAASDLRRIAKKHPEIPELLEVAKSFVDAHDRLFSLRELFAPLLSDIDKDATERLRVQAVVNQAVSAVRTLMPGVEFQLRAIPTGLRFPQGSLAEWNALLQNILTNAWNAMLDSDRALIKFSGGSGPRKREWLRISDTGKGLSVDLNKAKKLFEPFERSLNISEDRKSIALGGQGLGLSIVRMIARRRKADVEFVEPEKGFSTTLELSWKG
jgi:signal transduction histidine kinase